MFPQRFYVFTLSFHLRILEISSCVSKEELHRAYILPTSVYCSQVWHHCGDRNTSKLEKVDERALRHAIIQ